MYDWKVKTYGREAEETLTTQLYFIDALKEVGKLDEAERHLRSLLTSWRRLKGEEHYGVLELSTKLIAFLMMHRNAKAEACKLYHAVNSRARHSDSHCTVFAI